MPPIRLLERNPHYLEYRGKPALLVSSAEHYGAVINLDFDYVRYLDALAADGFNQTRLFTGVFREAAGSHRIADNTLGPSAGRYVCPWARSGREGYAGGGARFDLERWDEAYFRRLKDCVAQAGRRGVIVEVVLFCYWYNETFWALSPLQTGNNVNGVGDGSYLDFYSKRPSALLDAQERMVRKIVTELNEFDNLYFEVMNEPYSFHDGSAALDWQRHMIDLIVSVEAGLPQRHLIAQGIQNRTMRIVEPHPAVSIFNFHYALPSAAGDNYHLHKVLADDETGFKGQTPELYRREAWEFMLAGGGVFSHLDYSFTTASPEGNAPIRGETPGYGGPCWRRQLRALKQFLEGFDFPALRPHDEVVMGMSVDNVTHVLAEPGKAYAVYVCGGRGPALTVELGLPPGRYQAEWVSTQDGHVQRGETFDHPGGGRALRSPECGDDVALRVLRQG